MNSIGFEPKVTGFALYTASQGLHMSSKVIDSTDICGARKGGYRGFGSFSLPRVAHFFDETLSAVDFLALKSFSFLSSI